MQEPPPDSPLPTPSILAPPDETPRGFFLQRPAAMTPTKTTTIEGVQCGTKLSNNCLLLTFILTVEDEFLISEYLRAILEGGGHRVIATFDADEAIEVLGKGSRCPACHYRY